MKYIGDDYYEFTCSCGQVVLVQEGDMIHTKGMTPLCERCGENHPTIQFGSKSEKVICEICRERLDEHDDPLPTEHEDGEITTVCRECQRLDWEGEEWKDT
jgi:hypothetical protein